MVQGTGSHVGKSLLVAGLCRIFSQKGYRVAPFKAQNMALNSFVTEGGGEMGRAQVVQAEAAGLKPVCDMNPVLIKPQTDIGAQVIIQGKVIGNFSAVEYHHYKKEALKAVRESYQRLKRNFDLIIIEGAGSPAEINLKKNDIVNMRMAKLAHSSVIIVSDIDRGGVFASLVGTMELLTKAERKLVKGFVINKFRGDLSLLTPGIKTLERKTGVKVLGVVPFFRDIYIPDEDGVSLEEKNSSVGGNSFDIGVIKLPHISNFTDFDPLEREKGVSVTYIEKLSQIEGQDVLIIPGSKNTIDDLAYLKKKGFEKEIVRFKKQGKTIVGICGGFQMLGKSIEDPHTVESSRKSIPGLGLLDVDTQFSKKKATDQVEAEELHDTNGPLERLRGYEIHMGRTKRSAERNLFKIVKKSGKPYVRYEGAVSADGKVWGTYIHGIFDNDGFRKRFVSQNTGMDDPVSCDSKTLEFHDFKDRQFNALADLVNKSLDIEYITRLIS
jgi:adenosylcobyric acid synthase